MKLSTDFLQYNNNQLILQKNDQSQGLDPMDISQEEKDGITIVNINGRLDASTSSTLEETLSIFNTQEKVKVLMNCQELEYISSAGLRVLLSAAKNFKKNHSKIALAALCPNVKQVFEISGFTSIFQIYSTIEEAIEDLNM